jgi:hypothetical protein
MSIDSSVVPEIKITPPDGELLYVNPYIGEKTTIDEYGNVQITHGYLRADWDSSYPPTYKVKSDWDGVHDSVQGLVYGSSSPLTYNVAGGILYVPDGGDVIDSAAECKWKEVKELYIADIENSTEPSDLKNTKSNIRKIKPDINSELKRV